MEIIESHGYIAQVVDCRTEADAKRREPTKKARRWVVEVCHSWFNRFRKLLVRYEKLERSFMALNHIAAAIIAFRKVRLTVNIICGSLLSGQKSNKFNWLAASSRSIWEASVCKAHETSVFSKTETDKICRHV